jgi:hypothetical protein
VSDSDYELFQELREAAIKRYAEYMSRRAHEDGYEAGYADGYDAAKRDEAHPNV